jgi:AcrR family transcriptional regulator
MPAPFSSVDTAPPPQGTREIQRLRTRARLFDTAVAEIGKSGLAGADVAAIAATAGVARGTFYFHFPTKEHVLVELERAEEAKIVATLAAEASDDVEAMLTSLVQEVLSAEKRLGPIVFRDMLGLHFSATRPMEEEADDHPLAEFVIERIADAQARGKVSADADAAELGLIFMTGLFALLATTAAAPRSRPALLDRYVTTIVRGMEAA